MKNYLSAFATLLLFSITFSCTKKSKPCFNVDTSYMLYLQDNAGNDLLNPSTTGFYVHSDIGLYEKGMVLIQHNLVVPPSGNQSKYLIGIKELGKTAGNNQHIAYLKLSDKDIDTIQVETTEVECGFYKNKIWYNQKLVWDKDGEKTMPITIVK